MKKKKILIVIFILFIIIICASQNSYATIDSVINNMSGVQTAASGADTGIGKVINIIIGLMQIAGSGISLIVVTMMGIKYILASADEKADVKKQIIPIVIGCVLLFGAVNLMAALEEFSLSSFGE